MIYRAKSPRRRLEWGDLLILFNRNNCSLSVGVFSSSLICESIAVQFPEAVSNLCSARGENSCGERFYFLEDNELLSKALGTFGFLPRGAGRLCCCTATSTHFWSSTTYYTTFHREATPKNALELPDYSVKIRSQVQTITRGILPRNQSPSVSIS